VTPSLPPILLVSQVFPPAVGGSGVLLENVYSRITAADVTVFTDRATCGGAEQRRGTMTIDRMEIDAHRWGALDLRSQRQHLRLARRIVGFAKHRRPVVHCARAQPEGVPALLAGLWPGGPKYVFWVHGEELTTARTSRDFSAVMTQVHRGAAAAVANCRHTAALLESMGMPRDRIRVVYPGVDTDRFAPGVEGGDIRARYARARDVVVMTVGRLQRRKGHDVAIAAMARLAPELPGLRYVIVGDGEERPRLERLVSEFGLGERVRFAGEVSSEELPRYFAACDIFLMPNRVDGHDFEGFGIVFLEAAAAGKPVVAGRSGGAPEAVAEGRTALLVDPESDEAVAAAVSRLARSSDERRALGEAGRARVVDEFTWGRAAAAVTSLHAELAESGSTVVGSAFRRTYRSG
jgi:phosphatidylinositol alpha-1,6-mannosyltransferase